MVWRAFRPYVTTSRSASTASAGRRVIARALSRLWPPKPVSRSFEARHSSRNHSPTTHPDQRDAATTPSSEVGLLRNNNHTGALCGPVARSAVLRGQATQSGFQRHTPHSLRQRAPSKTMVASPLGSSSCGQHWPRFGWEHWRSEPRAYLGTVLGVPSSSARRVGSIALWARPWNYDATLGSNRKCRKVAGGER